MKRVALGLLITLTASTVHADPPAWMPAPPPRPTSSDEHEIKRLKRDATAFGIVGLALLAGGIAVDVVALDLPQAEQSVRQPDGSIVEQHVRGDANWAELAGGLALTATGLALVSLAYLKIKQARKLAANE